MTTLQSAPAMASEYKELPRPTSLLETLRHALESFVVHFWLF